MIMLRGKPYHPLHPLKIKMLTYFFIPNMKVWFKWFFLFKQLIFRFQPFDFPGVKESMCLLTMLRCKNGFIPSFHCERRVTDLDINSETAVFFISDTVFWWLITSKPTTISVVLKKKSHQQHLGTSSGTIHWSVPSLRQARIPMDKTSWWYIQETCTLSYQI